MKRLLLISVALMMTGCVAVPVYESGYYYPYYYGPYPYGYPGPEVNVFVSGFHGRHFFHDSGRGFHDGGGGFHGGGGGSHGRGR